MRVLAITLLALMAASAAPAPSAASFAKLVSSLRHFDPDVRLRAADRLVDLGPRAKAAVPQLATLLRVDPRLGARAPDPAPTGELAARALAAVGPDGRRALEEALDSGHVVAAYHAAGAFAAMGNDAEASVPSLVRALDIDLSAEMKSLRWHPWMGLVGELRQRLLGILEELGPRAHSAVPKLLTILKEGPATMRGYVLGSRNLVRTLLAIDPMGEEVVEGVLEALRDGTVRPRLHQDTVLSSWLAGRGAKAVPALAAMVVRDPARAEGRASAKLLVRADRPSLETVRRLLELHEECRRDLLDSLAEAGPLPDEVLPLAVERFLASAAGSATVLARASRTVVPLMRERMAKLGYVDDRWRELRRLAPDLAGWLTAAWLRHRRPETPGEAGEDGRIRTPLHGGEGGGDFEDLGPPGSLLVGLRFQTGHLGVDSVVRSLRPLYLHDDARAEGKAHGHQGGRGREIVAREGYAVAGLLVRTGSRLQGFAVVFMRVKDGTLDPDDAYVSGWVGAIESEEPILIGGDGRAVVGVCGRAGADIDAVGLVLGEAASDG